MGGYKAYEEPGGGKGVGGMGGELRGERWNAGPLSSGTKGRAFESPIARHFLAFINL